MMQGVKIRSARPADFAAICELLRSQALPHEDLSKHLRTALVAERAGDILGSAALEIYGEYALLRSLAVAPALHGQGLGSLLTTRILRLARRQNVAYVFLLTTTASKFFPRFGFTPFPRAEAPASIRQTSEFQRLCPATAVCLVRRFAAGKPAARRDRSPR